MNYRTRMNFISILFIGVILVLNTLIISIFVSEHLKNNAKSATEAVEKQRMMVVEQVFDEVATMTQKPMINNQILQVLQADYSQIDDRQQSAIDNEIAKTVDDFFYTDMFYKNNYVYAVTLFPFNRSEVYYKQFSGRSLLPQERGEMDWYRQVLHSSGRQEIIFPAQQQDLYRGDQQEVLSVGRLLIDPLTNQGMGILRIDISIKALAKTLSDIDLQNQDSDTLLTDEKDRLMFTSFSGKTWRQDFQQAQEGNVVTEVASDKYGFKLFHLFPETAIYQPVGKVLLMIALLSILCMAAGILIVRFTTRQMLRPIKELNDSMHKVQAGDLTVRMPDPGGNGEFEEVTHSFNMMVANTQELIGLVKKEAAEKQRLEYAALQSQISPHFISNTISAIRWMAYLDGNQPIEKALDSFYHLLNFAARAQEEKIPIAIELKQLQYYLDIISLRYYQKFTITMEVEEAVASYYTIKYLVQTLVENSIFHGLETADDGKIHICIRLEDDRIIYEISDNGVGMSQERIQEVLSGNYQQKSHGGIGIYNIDRRIRLIFGQEYGVAIESVENEYTVVTVSLPAERVEEDEASHS